jgi:hypothetical protein
MQQPPPQQKPPPQPPLLQRNKLSSDLFYGGLVFWRAWGQIPLPAIFMPPVHAIFG